MVPATRSSVSTLLAGALVLVAGACSREAAPAAPASSGWKPRAPVNAIFIVIDTLRGDVLLDPEGRYDTPNLDRLGREGIVFPRAYSAAPMTLPSHMSLFSSRPPFETKVLNNGQTVPKNLPLLADWLAHNGYHTRAVISLGTLNPLDREQNPARGFDAYDFDYRDIALAEDTNRRLFASLAGRDATAPLFLFAHFADPHEPYDAHGTEVKKVDVFMDGKPLDQIVVSDMNPWSRELALTGGRTVFEFVSAEQPAERFRVRRFDCLEAGRPAALEWELGKQMERLSRARIVVDRGSCRDATCEVRFWLNDVPETDALRRRRYELEVAYVDGRIGELLTELERLGLYQDSLIVFTSDHGEALGERKMFGHVERLTDEQIHVPLIVKLPRDDPRGPELRRAAERLVTHLDVVPTLLEIVGVSPLPGQRGTSLFQPHDPVHVAQTHRPEAKRTQLALRDAYFKMIFYPAVPEAVPPLAERFELYDLQADPGELQNLYRTHADERPDWTERLRKLHQQSAGSFEESPAGETEAERREREEMLRALGYGGDGDAEG